MALPPIQTSRTSPNSNGRPGSPRFIVIHHWGSRGQKFDNVVHWLCQKRARVSAHYVAMGGRVARLVPESERAWHAGDDYGNDYGIGVECRPEATDADYATVAALVQSIRSRRGDLPLRAHREFTDTQCPGSWDLDRLDALARGKSTPPRPAVKPGTAPPFPLPRLPGALFYYGAPDGPLESVSGRGPNTRASGDVSKVGGRWRSRGLQTWQARMRARGYGLDADGRYGPATEAAARNLQRLAGLQQDGKIGPATWAAAWTLPVQ